MNRYMRDGLLADMRQGKRVLYLAASRHEARHVLDELAFMLEPGERAHRTHGYEKVTSPTGGFVHLSSVGSCNRGLSVDVVALDADPTTEQLERVLPSIQVRPGGELIRL